LERHLKVHAETHDLRSAGTSLLELVELFGESPFRFDLRQPVFPERSHLPSQLVQGRLSQRATTKPIDQKPPHDRCRRVEQMTFRLKPHLAHVTKDLRKSLVGNVCRGEAVGVKALADDPAGNVPHMLIQGGNRFVVEKLNGRPAVRLIGCLRIRRVA
jgi:hypothetical protein